MTEEKARTKEKYRLAAYSAFLMGAGGEEVKTFKEFLSRLGLKKSNEPEGPIPDQEEQVSKEQSLAKADAILAMIREKGAVVKTE